MDFNNIQMQMMHTNNMDAQFTLCLSLQHSGHTACETYSNIGVMVSEQEIVFAQHIWVWST